MTDSECVTHINGEITTKNDFLKPKKRHVLFFYVDPPFDLDAVATYCSIYCFLRVSAEAPSNSPLSFLALRDLHVDYRFGTSFSHLQRRNERDKLLTMSLCQRLPS